MIHKFHVSVSQFEFDPRTGKTTMVIRVFADDLENAISRHAGRHFPLLGRDGAEVRRDQALHGAIYRYLQGRIELRSRGGRPAPLRWGGLEARADLVWLYLEARLPGGIRGAQLRHRLFCEIFDDQVNIVNAIESEGTSGLLFEVDDDFKVFEGPRARP
jgi:hypothetical protein